MKKVFLTLLSFLICLTANAASVKSDLNSVINDSDIDKNSISVSIKDLSNGQPVYELNEKILRNPASVQKALTIIPIIETLGKDYKFKTQLFEKNENEYLIKLGADPLLKTSDLKTLTEDLKSKTIRLSIDDSILEKKDWGEGWQWDDDLNELMPRFNSYNLDNNLLKITVMPTEYDKRVQIINPSKYPLVFFNNVITSDENELKVSRDNSISSNTLVLEGTVNTPTVVTIPIDNLKKYFDIRITIVLSEKKVYLNENILL